MKKNIFISSALEIQNPRSLAGLALCLALTLVLNLWGSIYITDSIKLSLFFLPLALCGMLYGPVWTAVVAALADVFAAILMPHGPFFIGYTVTAFLTGSCFGLFLYPFKTDWWRIVFSKSLINVFLNIGLNSYWLYLTTNNGVWLTGPRIIKNLVMLPIEIGLMFAILLPLKKPLKNLLTNKKDLEN